MCFDLNSEGDGPERATYLITKIVICPSNGMIFTYIYLELHTQVSSLNEIKVLGHFYGKNITYFNVI